MKDPRLHVKLSDLSRLFDMFSIDKSLAPKILEAAHDNKMQIRKECIVTVSNSKDKKKAQRKIDSIADNVELFNRIYMAVLQQRQKKNVAPIFKNSKNYATLSAVANMADKYKVDFEFTSLETAYTDFVEKAVQCMDVRKFALNKVGHYLSDIYAMAECEQVVKRDNNQQGTQVLFNAWQTIGLSYTSVPLTLINKSDYVHFVYARIDADSVGADYGNWVRAQFEALAFLRKIPELSQFYGENAVKRYNKYATNAGVIQPVNHYSHATTAYTDDAHKAYIEKLKAKRPVSK